MPRVKQGRLIEVENKERRFGSANNYVAVWVEDADGKNERCLLLTKAEVRKATERASKNMEDLTKKDFLTNLFD